MSAPDGDSFRIHNEQVRLLYANGPTLVIANLLALSLFLYIDKAWQHPLDQIWSLLLGLVLIGQTLLILLVKQLARIRLQTWRYLFLLGALLIGLLWTALLMQVLSSANQSPDRLLTIALIGVIFTLTSLILTIDSLFSFLFILASAGLLIINPTGQQMPLTVEFWTGLTAYLLALLVLAGWMIVNQQRFLVVAANRTLLQERTGQTESAMNDLRTRLSMIDDQRQQLEKELYLTKEAAQQANLAKSEFLATMSHEIRTPLNGILPILEMLLETDLDEEQQGLVTTAQNSSQLLLSIINDILDFSKIDAGKLTLEVIEMNLSDMVEQVTALLRNAATKRGLTLDFKIHPEVPEYIRSDPIRLRQILANLVSNAIKFTESGGVSVEVARHNGSRAEVELLFVVRDTGIGMTEHQVKRLFEPFFQADASTTRKHGGTGLGLAICKRLVDLMGGHIGVKSQPNRGSYFWFVIPLRKSLRQTSKAMHHLSGIRTLILSSEQDPRSLPLMQQLQGWGMRCDRVTTQLEALRSVKSSVPLGASRSYELVLIDAQATGLKLSETIPALRQLPQLSGTEFIVVDALPADWGFLQTQSVARLSSPLRQDELEARLKRLLDLEQRTGAGHRQPQLTTDQAAWKRVGFDSIPEPNAGEVPPSRARKHIPLLGRVLVVEDNPVNQAVVKKMLEKAGLSPETADDGVEALAAIERETFDIVLMDCQMPRLDGYETTQSIRQREQLKGLLHIPIIAMTAYAMTGDRERCLAAGMDDYLAKPVNPSVLENKLRQWLPMQDLVNTDSETTETNPSDHGAETAEEPGDDHRFKTDTAHSENAAILDREVLAELHEIMEEAFVSILQSYLDNAPTLLQEIEEAVLHRQPDRLVAPAHSLKSSSANVGAMATSRLAGELESKGILGDSTTVTTSYQALFEAYQKSAAELQRIVAQGSLE